MNDKRVISASIREDSATTRRERVVCSFEEERIWQILNFHPMDVECWDGLR